MNLDTAYHVLKLSPAVDTFPDERTLKRAYRKASLLHHPDRNLDDPVAAAERFKAIQEASSGEYLPVGEGIVRILRHHML